MGNFFPSGAAPSLPSPAPENPDLEQRIERLEAVVKNLERLLTGQAAAGLDANLSDGYQRLHNLARGMTGTESPAQGAYLSGSRYAASGTGTRGAALAQDGKVIVVLASDGAGSELAAFDTASGRPVWKTRLPLPGATHLEVTDGTVRVSAGTETAEVELPSGNVLRSTAATDDAQTTRSSWGSYRAVEASRTEARQREHQAEERLRELDLKGALLGVETAKIKLLQLRQGNASESEIAQAEIAIRQAELDVERAETALELHRESRGAPQSKRQGAPGSN